MHRLNLGVETENTAANIAMRTHGRQFYASPRKRMLLS